MLLRQEHGNSLLCIFTLLPNEPGVSLRWPKLRRKLGEGLRLGGGFTVTTGGKLLVLTGFPADFCDVTSDASRRLGQKFT